MKSGIHSSNVSTKDLEGRWVALTLDHKKVLDWSADLASLEKKMADNKKVVYMKVMASDREFAF
jgi:hypothetical protein